MELSRLALAMLVGCWSLVAQFIFNRIIFFYVANSEYTAASIIALHLTGFWLGAAVARRHVLPLGRLLWCSLGLVVAIDLLVWRLGLLVLGLPLTMGLAVAGGLSLAGLSGAVVVRLMQETPASADSQGVVVADTAGSVVGALVGGFLMLPVFGIKLSFMLVVALQVAALVIEAKSRSLTFKAFGAAYGGLLLLVAMFLVPAVADVHSQRVVAVDGMVIMDRNEENPATLLYSARSPYGMLSVVQRGEIRILSIDGRPLCTNREGGKLDMSAWDVGAWPVRALDTLDKPKALVANIGLGCGMTLAGMLSELSGDGRVDVIEINPGMPEAQTLFRPLLQHGTDDPRVNLIIADGFQYFAQRTPGADHPYYDAVGIDVAWMQNMNATHLFSREMYLNIRRNLAPNGILSVWSEETNPFSMVSLIIYRTLKDVFPNVVVDMQEGVVLFYASAQRADLANFNSERGNEISGWMEEASARVPVNRLDNLVMNRHKFTLWGDSHWEQMYSKYRAIDD
jgi:spermidine synthase